MLLPIVPMSPTCPFSDVSSLPLKEKVQYAGTLENDFLKIYLRVDHFYVYKMSFLPVTQAKLCSLHEQYKHNKNPNYLGFISWHSVYFCFKTAY
jgi:hypothetical protein